MQRLDEIAIRGDEDYAALSAENQDLARENGRLRRELRGALTKTNGCESTDTDSGHSSAVGRLVYIGEEKSQAAVKTAPPSAQPQIQPQTAESPAETSSSGNSTWAEEMVRAGASALMFLFLINERMRFQRRKAELRAVGQLNRAKEDARQLREELAQTRKREDTASNAEREAHSRALFLQKALAEALTAASRGDAALSLVRRHFGLTVVTAGDLAGAVCKHEKEASRLAIQLASSSADVRPSFASNWGRHNSLNLHRWCRGLCSRALANWNAHWFVHVGTGNIFLKTNSLNNPANQRIWMGMEMEKESAVAALKMTVQKLAEESLPADRTRIHTEQLRVAQLQTALERVENDAAGNRRALESEIR